MTQDPVDARNQLLVEAGRPAIRRELRTRPAWWMDTGPSFEWSEKSAPAIDWRGSAYAGLMSDAFQTGKFDTHGIPEINPIARGFQDTLGHDTGTAAYFALAAAAMDQAGKKAPWIYPAVTGLQAATVLANRRFPGVGGIPIPIISGRFRT
jgi:hypothetical protein